MLYSVIFNLGVSIVLVLLLGNAKCMMETFTLQVQVHPHQMCRAGTLPSI